MTSRPGSGRLAIRHLAYAPLAGISTTLLAALPLPAFAQAQSANLPTREDLDPVPAEKAPAKPRLTVDGDVERAPCALDDPAYKDIRFKFDTVEFNNLGPVAPEVLRDTYAQYLGSEQPVDVVCRIRDAAATRLRSLGYIAAVQVPAQRIENATVRFEVLYAKVTSVRVVGQPGRNEKVIEGYLSRLADGQLFNRFEAERYLLLARDIPGYDVRLSLKPAGTGAGNMIAEVTLRHTPLTVDFSAQNLAAPSTGRVGGQLRATFNGLTGMGDRTFVSLYSTAQTREQQILQLGHEVLVGRNGLRLGGRFTYAWTQPDLGAAIPDVKARTLYLNAEAAYPLIRRQALTLRAVGGLDYVDQKVSFVGPFSEDKVRVGYLRFDLDALDLKGVGPGGSIGWRLGGSLEARKGLSIFGASPDCLKAVVKCAAPGFVRPSLADADPNATAFRFAGNAEWRALRGVTLGFSPRAQVSTAPLFAFEQYSTGNYSIGRGYDPGAVVGDDGAGFQAELRLDGFRLSPKSAVDLKPYVFSDNAWVWDRATPGGVQRLNSVGGGMRIGFAGRARLDVGVGAPLTKLAGETKRRDPRLLISFSTNLLPWSNR